jgi:hypothetical protein
MWSRVRPGWKWLRPYLLSSHSAKSSATSAAKVYADLAESRRLIEHHGYGRCLDELADAEAAIRV